MELSVLQMNSVISMKNGEYKYNTQQLEHLRKMELLKAKKELYKKFSEPC
jgi:hypothetical protein